MWREPSEYVDELARAVIGAAIEVHRQLGPGYLESVYESAMAEELTLRAVQHESQVTIPVIYKGRAIAEHRLDLLVGGELVVELKAVSALTSEHVAQTLSYLKAGAFHLGLVINFSHSTLRAGIRRVVLDQ